MTDASPSAPTKHGEQSRPLLFISHRHDDFAIAEIVRGFLTYHSGNSIAVYQSSSEDGQAPKIGRNVNRELKQALWKSDVIVLIYTGQGRDWDYCMWECGVATHSESEETRVIVLQCGKQLPRVFADQLAVDLRDQGKVRRFANEFLTDPHFFPHREQAVTQFQPNDKNVERAASNLFEDLQEVLPDTGDEIEEWPAVPYLRLELSASQVREIVGEEEDERARALAFTQLMEAGVLESDREAAALFGRPTLPAGEPFGEVLPRSARAEEAPDWLASLAHQVMRAAKWNFPAVQWGLMRSANENDGTWYSPVLTHVRRLPTRTMQFDVHFQRFACPPGSTAVSLPLPGAGSERQRADAVV